MGILALSFDADNTLWNPHNVYRQGLETTLAAMIERGDVSAGQVTVQNLVEGRSHVRAEFQGQPHRMEDIRERSFAYVLERQGHANPGAAAAELIEIYLDVRFAAVELYPEVGGALRRLKSAYPLGLLTNGNTYPDRCGLPGVFDVEVFCAEHATAKPDERVFEIIAGEFGVSPAEMLHIGDDWDDVEGANGVGATSVFINRTGVRPSWAEAADHEVANLVELEALLAALP